MRSNVRQRAKMKQQAARSLARWATLVAAMCVVLSILSSCTRRSDDAPSPVALPESFSASGEAAAPEQWWTSFGDPGLDRFIEQALEGNFSLRIAWDRLDQARAVARKTGAALWPDVEAGASASRSEQEPNESDRSDSEYALGLAASYEVDLWGRVRSRRDAARLDAHAAGRELHAAAITLTAEVARTWFQLIERHTQLALLDEQIEANAKYLDVITLQFRRGQASATDVLQQRQLVESVRGERLLVESDAMVLEHQLAVLVGRAPGTLTLDVPRALPSLPPMPRTGVPAELVRYRPDIRAAELAIRAADRRVAEAIADRFPRLGLTLNANTSADEVGGLFDSWLATLVANLTAPLFDAGGRRAEVERTRAVLSEQVNTYGAAVLAALKEVEDVLAQEAKQAEYVASLRTQLGLSEQATTQTLNDYRTGASDFTRYLTTLLSHQRLQRTFVQAELQLVLYRIGLYRALAGAWELPRPWDPALDQPPEIEPDQPDEHAPVTESGSRR